MRWTTVAVLGLGLAFSSPVAHANDASRLKLAREVIKITHLSDKIKGLLPLLGNLVREALSREGVDPARTDTTVRRVQAPSPENLDRLMTEVASLYAKKLTEQDLSNALVFYHTASGQHMLAKEAEIGGAIGVLAQHWATDIVDRAVADMAKEATTSPDQQRWRQEYIAAPNRAAVLQRFVDPMDKPQWTALRTVTLATLIADQCLRSQLDGPVLAGYVHETGLDEISVHDLDTIALIIAPEFSYFDDEQLRLMCAAADDLFGNAGRLVPHLVSAGSGTPAIPNRGFFPVTIFMGFPHRAVADMAKEATTSPDQQRWRQEYIAAPNRAAVLQGYVDPMDNPQWTALRTVTLAKLVADRCQGSQMDQRVLDSYLEKTGLDQVSIGDLDTIKLTIVPEFSYFDDDRLKLVCAAAGDLFGGKGKLVPNLLSPGNGLSKPGGRGYMSVSPFTDFPHRRG